MKRLFALSLCLCLFPLAGPARAQESPPSPAAAELSLMTGREAGTYYQIGRDLKQLAGRHQIDLDVIPSAGSLENIFKVYEYPSIQLGLSQFDTLSLIAMQAAVGDDADAEELQNVVNSMQLVLPLYQEEVHVLAKSPEIKQFADLNGKKVAMGDVVSGTYGTASILLELFQIKPAEQLELDAVAALDALRQGQVDAMIYVVGAPAKLFVRPFETGEQPHLVSVTIPDKAAKHDIFQSFYRATTIPAGTYGWQDQEVATLAVGTVLFTSDKGPDEERCRAIGRFARMVYDNLDGLRGSGHPKWKSVTIDREALLKAPHLSPCVAQAFK